MSLSPTTDNIDVNSVASPDKETNVFFVKSVNTLYTRLENESLTPNALIRLEQAIPSLCLLSWLQSNNAHKHASYWSNRDKSFGISGIGCAIKLQTTKRSELPKLFRQIKEIIQDRSVRFIGGIAFNERVSSNTWENFPFAQFILPEIEIVYRDNQYILAVNLFAKDLPQLKRQHQQRLKRLKELRFTSLNSSSNSGSALSDHKILERVNTPRRDQWKTNVNFALSKIKAGKLNKVVLSRDTKLTINAPLSAPQLLKKWQEVNENGFLFCIQNGQSTFLGNSPERLYSREHAFINTEAIAGTVPRGVTPMTEKAGEQQLINDPKLIREHKVVADYITLQLKDICDHISNMQPLSILKLANIQHLKTPFKARLKPSISDSNIILKLHPTPAVCGSPLNESMSLIDQQEESPRGWYAGLVGTISENEAEFCVAIRSILLKSNTIHCYSGVGLVEGSEEASEWDELESKIQTVLSLFQA